MRSEISLQVDDDDVLPPPLLKISRVWLSLVRVVTTGRPKLIIFNDFVLTQRLWSIKLLHYLPRNHLSTRKFSNTVSVGFSVNKIAELVKAQTGLEHSFYIMHILTLPILLAYFWTMLCSIIFGIQSGSESHTTFWRNLEIFPNWGKLILENR